MNREPKSRASSLIFVSLLSINSFVTKKTDNKTALEFKSIFLENLYK